LVGDGRTPPQDRIRRMKFQAVLSKTSTDVMKSKQMSNVLTQIVLDAYLTPDQWAEFITKFYDKEIEVEVK